MHILGVMLILLATGVALGGLVSWAIDMPSIVRKEPVGYALLAAWAVIMFGLAALS